MLFSSFLTEPACCSRFSVETVERSLFLYSDVSGGTFKPLLGYYLRLFSPFSTTFFAVSHAALQGSIFAELFDRTMSSSGVFGTVGLGSIRVWQSLEEEQTCADQKSCKRAAAL